MHKLRDAPGDAQEALRAELGRLAGRGRVYVLGLGNTDRADDGAGILVAKNLKALFPEFSYSEEDGVEGVVLDISERDEPSVSFFVDAAELRQPPGTIKVVAKDDINDREITTHRVSVALLASVLEKAGKGAAVICVQPGTVQFRGQITRPVLEAIDSLVRALESVMTERDG
jgi:hydrogenase maturation protease